MTEKKVQIHTRVDQDLKEELLEIKLTKPTVSVLKTSGNKKENTKNTTLLQNCLDIKTIGTSISKNLKLLHAYDLYEFKEVSLKGLLLPILSCYGLDLIISELEVKKEFEESYGYLDLLLGKKKENGHDLWLVELKYSNISYWNHFDNVTFKKLKDPKKIRNHVKTSVDKFNAIDSWTAEEFNYGYSPQQKMKEAEIQVKNYRLDSPYSMNNVSGHLMIVGCVQNVWIKLGLWNGSKYDSEEHIIK
jgi:hypothetical protein